MLTAILCLLGLIAGAAHGGVEGALGAAVGLAAGLWISARSAQRERDLTQKLRELDDKSRWLYDALTALQRERSAAPPVETALPDSEITVAPVVDPAAAPIGSPTTPTVSAQAAPLDALHAPGVRVAAVAAGMGPAAPKSRSPSASPSWSALWARLMGGNPLARIGVVVLFFGVASALRLAAQAGLLPPQLRLAGALAVGLVMIVAGWRMTGDGPRRLFALAVQGGGFALLYLSVYFALERYGFIGPAPAFGLFAALGAACALMAARQSAQSLALLGLSGAFVAPVLAATGRGDHIVLLSYTLLLDFFVIALSWRHAWRALILAGFLFTFVIATGWGLRSYTPDDYLAVQGFLIAFFLLFSATPVALTVARAPEEADRTSSWNSGSLLFGPPLAAGVLQATLMQPFEYGDALSAIAVGLYYLALAWLLRTRAPAASLAFRAHAGIGAALLTLAVPLAFDLQMTAAVYAVEGAAALWYGCVRGSRLTLWAGAALQGLAGLWLVAALPGLTLDWPLANGRALGCLLMTGAALASVRVLRVTAATGDGLPQALTIWLAGWWLFGGLADIDDFAPSALQPALALLFAMASAAFAEQQGRRHTFVTARGLATLSLPVLWAGSLVGWDMQHHLLFGAMALALPLAWATHIWILRRQDEDGGGLFSRCRHVATAWTLLLSVGVEAGGWLDVWLPGQDLWRWLAWLAVWLMAGVALQRALADDRDEWPFSAQRDGYEGYVLRPVAALLLLSVAALQLALDGGSALRYLPLASALDAASIAALRWLARSQSQPLLPVPLTGAVALLWVSALAARSVHHLAGVAWSAQAMFQSTLLQATLSLTWTLTALGLMIHATRRGARTLWIAGFALLAAVGAKLLLVDLAGAGTVEWAASLLGIGALILIASYVAPVPPGTDPEGVTS